MGFNIEISINLLKQNNYNYTEMENDVIEFAHQCNCYDIHTFSEEEWDSKLSKCKSIIVCMFSNENMDNFLRFIRIIKNMKKNKPIYIECIYNDEILPKLIYASTPYLKTTHKNTINNYTMFKRNRSYSEDEQKIIDVLDNK
jgi:hypothetical protein